jgi:hypothetical protein
LSTKITAITDRNNIDIYRDRRKITIDYCYIYEIYNVYGVHVPYVSVSWPDDGHKKPKYIANKIKKVNN